MVEIWGLSPCLERELLRLNKQGLPWIDGASGRQIVDAEEFGEAHLVFFSNDV